MGVFRLTLGRLSGPVRLLPCLAVLLAVACSCGACGKGGTSAESPVPGDFPDDLPRPVFETAVIEISGQQITVEIADTQDRRQYGMMFVSDLPDDRGMLFLYPTPRYLTFWMRNTRIPLDIAFIGEVGGKLRIVKIHESMTPFQESPGYSSVVDICRYAVELPGGWFARHGGRAEDVVQFPEEVRAMQGEEDGRFRPNIPRRRGR